MFYPTGTKKINENVYAVRSLMVNFFVFTDGVDHICIDSGMSGIFAKMGLKKLGIDPDDISHLFLTHTDYDHAGGVKVFKNARTYISENEEQMINGTTSRLLKLKYNRLKTDYNLLKDNEEIQIGNIKVKAIDTPGHTPGSMSYIINDTYLFSGDTMTLRWNKLYPFYRLQNMDTKKQRETINRLAEVDNDISWVFTAHTGYSDNYKEAIKRWS